MFCTIDFQPLDDRFGQPAKDTSVRVSPYRRDTLIEIGGYEPVQAFGLIALGQDKVERVSSFVATTMPHDDTESRLGLQVLPLVRPKVI